MPPLAVRSKSSLLCEFRSLVRPNQAFLRPGMQKAPATGGGAAAGPSEKFQVGAGNPRAVAHTAGISRRAGISLGRFAEGRAERPSQQAGKLRPQGLGAGGDGDTAQAEFPGRASPNAPLTPPAASA